VARLTDRGALGEALDGCRAVVSCVGSFIDLGEAVVAAAIGAGVAYVDTSAEFPFLHTVFETYDAPARAAGVAVVPGMAFYAAPADFAAALAVRALGTPPDSVEIGYRLAGARPSKGTLRTNLRRAGQPCPIRRDGHRVFGRVGDGLRRFEFPEPDGPVTAARWPGAEVLTVPRHTGADSVSVFLGMPAAAAAVLRRPRLTALLRPMGAAVVGRGTGGPSEAARRRARFVIVAEARAAVGDAGADNGRAVRCVVAGHDLYGVTASACAEAVQRLAVTGDGPSGVLAPAEAFDPAAFLDALAPHLTWRVEQ
jgi:short subunit dehydrogenase-like uncharacterized protein